MPSVLESVNLGYMRGVTWGRVGGAPWRGWLVRIALRSRAGAEELEEKADSCRGPKADVGLMWFTKT